MSFGLLDHAEVHLRRTAGRGDSESRVISSMAAHELIEVKIGQYVAVKNQERLVELFAQERQRSDRSQWFDLLCVSDPHVPLIPVTANAANEVAQESSRDEDVSNSVSSVPV